jgi:hypothetical protein
MSTAPHCQGNYQRDPMPTIHTSKHIEKVPWRRGLHMYIAVSSPSAELWVVRPNPTRGKCRVVA